MEAVSLPLSSLQVSPWNVRHDLSAGEEETGIEDLAASIQKLGLLNPLTVWRTEGEHYEVVVGQRRLLACQRIGLDPVPCLVRDDIDESVGVTLSLVENVHRADMSPMDKARALELLYEQLGSYRKVADETAWSETTVRKYVRLLDLPAELQATVGTADGPAGVGTLSRLATLFSGSEAVEVHGKIAGFTQKVQEEILRRSQGDSARVGELVEEAMEGAFDVRRCGGRYGCDVVKDVAEGRLEEEAFAELVQHSSRVDASATPDDAVLEQAARSFWRALARGGAE